MVASRITPDGSLLIPILPVAARSRSFPRYSPTLRGPRVRRRADGARGRVAADAGGRRIRLIVVP